MALGIPGDKPLHESTLKEMSDAIWWQCHTIPDMISQNWFGNGSVPPGTQPLLEPMLTEFHEGQ